MEYCLDTKAINKLIIKLIIQNLDQLSDQDLHDFMEIISRTHFYIYVYYDLLI